jgi:hypothetical protein
VQPIEVDVVRSEPPQAGFDSLHHIFSASPSLGDVNVESLDPKRTAQTGTIGTGLGWSDQFPALILGLLESCRGDVSSIHVEFGWSLQATEGLISKGFIQTGIVAG